LLLIVHQSWKFSEAPTIIQHVNDCFLSSVKWCAHVFFFFIYKKKSFLRRELTFIYHYEGNINQTKTTKIMKVKWMKPASCCSCQLWSDRILFLSRLLTTQLVSFHSESPVLSPSHNSLLNVHDPLSLSLSLSLCVVFMESKP
jgi:hypothetical protein